MKKKLNYLSTLFLLIGCLFVFTACPPNPTPDPTESENHSLFVAPDMIDFDANDENSIITHIICEDSWTINTTVSWVHFDHYSGKGNTYISVSVDANNSSEERSATFMIKTSYGETAKLIINQKGRSGDELDVTKSGAYFYADGMYFDLKSYGFAYLVSVEHDSKFTNYKVPSNVIYEGKKYAVTQISEMAFYNSKDESKNCIKSIIIPDGVTTIKSAAFAECVSLETIVLPNRLKEIEYATFIHCEKLESITIPEGVYSIGDHAFEECKQLKNINIPKDAIIGKMVFSGCSNLTGLSLDEDGFYKLIDNTIYSFDKTEIIECLAVSSGHYEIPKTVKKIHDGAFCQCNQITSINMPSTKISLGQGVFYGCSNLESIKLSSELESLPKNTFAECRKLNDVVLPACINDIDDMAFENCSSLTKLTCLSVEPPILSSSAFFLSKFEDEGILYVPSNSIEKYKEDEDWSNSCKEIRGIQSEL